MGEGADRRCRVSVKNGGEGAGGRCRVSVKDGGEGAGGKCRVSVTVLTLSRLYQATVVLWSCVPKMSHRW